MKNNLTKILSLRVAEKSYNKLLDIATNNGMSVTGLLRVILNYYLELPYNNEIANMNKNSTKILSLSVDEKSYNNIIDIATHTHVNVTDLLRIMINYYLELPGVNGLTKMIKGEQK